MGKEGKKTRRKSIDSCKTYNQIEKELLERLKQGTYGDIYNFSQKAFDQALDTEEVDEEDRDVETEEALETEREEELDEEDEDMDRQFVEDFDESDDEEDLEEF